MNFCQKVSINILSVCFDSSTYLVKIVLVIIGNIDAVSRCQAKSNIFYVSLCHDLTHRVKSTQRAEVKGQLGEF